jgi:hypothetical protein
MRRPHRLAQLLVDRQYEDRPQQDSGQNSPPGDKMHQTLPSLANVDAEQLIHGLQQGRFRSIDLVNASHGLLLGRRET